ncbi:MAG: UDP-N-acetylmuramoyl-L-alanine--D-glutamate ligase [Actinobacteria bacterium]|nr:UDP-N-acetylmuramoyl-L-alanine--D-glutamate ligase [Actinomycetota bacterium]
MENENLNKTNFFNGKNILIFGLGRSGLSTLNKLSTICKKILAVDNNPDFILPEEYKKLTEYDNIKFFISDNKDLINKLLKDINLIILSPGISMAAPLIRSAIRKKIEIWSELELAWFFLNENQRKNTIAITGTNGKTTVTSLIAKILNDFNLKAEPCGNIGNPLINTIDTDNSLNNKNLINYTKQENLIRVIEVSSFQLENIYDFNPHVALILNITNDHIDRHKSMTDYSKIKFKIFKNQSSSDFLIINSDDKNINKFFKKSDFINEIKPDLIKFSLNHKEDIEIYYENEIIHYLVNGLEGKISIKDRNLIGNHNILNIMGAIAAAKIFNVDDESISKSIKNFNPLPHRLEYVGVINGIKCFNDSKSTNPDATIKALDSFKKEVTLILGGLDKGMNFKSLIPVLNKKVLNLILIGSCKDKLYELFFKNPHDYKIYKALTFEEAVNKGFEVTNKNHSFLLSPACASMDMFKDYKDRGNQFKKIVLSYKK